VVDTAVKANQLNFATQGIYMWAIGLVKVSIGLFLLRFAPRRGYKVFIWAIIGLSVIGQLKCAADCSSVDVVIYDGLLLRKCLCLVRSQSNGLDAHLSMQKYPVNMGLKHQVKMFPSDAAVATELHKHRYVMRRRCCYQADIDSSEYPDRPDLRHTARFHATVCLFPFFEPWN
jgi:hypothetical protein